LNISKAEQRTLHALARGGFIVVEKDERGKIVEALCMTREGWSLSDCTMAIFAKLRSRRLIASSEAKPYRITRHGLEAVRSQLDNR
jgi:uncharacterized protein